MNPIARIVLVCLMGFTALTGRAQREHYQYSRPLPGIKDQWHTIVLPQEMLAKLQPSFADIRIWGITTKQDTIEAPYILSSSEASVINTSSSFDVINKSHNSNGSYATFVVPDGITLNHIALDFKQQNYDWKVTLEGSNDEKEWFTLVERFRIVSIQNAYTDFRFAQLHFPDSKYRYYRLFIPGVQDAELHAPRLSEQKTVAGRFKQYPVSVVEKREEHDTRQTRFTLDLKAYLPINSLKVFVHNKHDYFRPVIIEYVADSFKTEKGWKYNNTELGRGTLNSIDGNELSFGTRVARYLTVIIDNQDNQPLTIDSFAAKGPEYELVARFDEVVPYYLVYGNKNAAAPSYDITRFTDNIPQKLVRLTPGEEISTGQLLPVKTTTPLFEHKAWLWVIMGVIIVVIGWFSLSMIKKV